MITDFPANPLTNMSGLQTFSFAPFRNNITWPPVLTGRISSALIFTDGARFLNGYSTVSQLDFNETIAVDDNGPLYTWLITGFAPGDHDVLIDLVFSMAKERHIVLTTDHNGQLRLVGVRAPLIFTSLFGSGKYPANDSKGFTFSFAGQSRKSAPVYNAGK